MHSSLEIIATVLFGLAILHTFATKRFQHMASKYPEGSIGENLFHLLGEIEVVFGIWAGLLVAAIAFLQDGKSAVHYVESLNFTEPAFVFVIMTVAATRPLIRFAEGTVTLLAKLIPLKGAMPTYLVALSAGPLLGSFITEPAAMTVIALLLKDQFFDRQVSDRFKYLTLAVLFVNISIGGVLTNFAAPPVLMVASKWNWSTPFMLEHFGWKAALAVIFNVTLAALILRRELNALPRQSARQEGRKVPAWLTVVHLLFLGTVVLTSHHPIFFLGVFLFFQGFTQITQEYQDELKLKEALLVGFFLGGLVVLGSLQSWWLQPLLTSFPPFPLFLGATGLTAVMDNAALTFLGSQVPDISDALKYALVAGAVAGGGLTVIANAPNPAGFAILRSSFGNGGISPLLLAGYALGPTVIAMAALWCL